MVPPGEKKGQATCDVVVIGGSAGAIQPLMTLLHALPADFPAPVFVVIHVAPTTPGVLDKVLGRASPLPVQYARDGQGIEPGHVYLASPDRHLVLEDHVVRVLGGPKHNRHRPAIDPLFRSAALAFGSRVCGIILSGMLYDGTMGLHAVKEAGGIAIVQSLDEALHTGMPSNAINEVQVDHTATAAQIARLLVAADNGLSGHAPEDSTNMQEEIGLTGSRPKDVEEPLPLACPECGGVLSREGDSEPSGFRCFLGHTYSERALWEARVETSESLLWQSLRSLTELSTVGQFLLQRKDPSHEDRPLREIEGQVAQAERRAALLRDLLYDV